ncbi:methyltransferase domain protein [Mycobacterium ulcerans str. Harvey]|uniref:Methyltransferase domain protein n=1 Tax=Mycobacterium ulcerans str. Harvey TaxID=1299332 RepID=A0ABP3A256_MYCUL|nr:methyltransferase domain protein [Mycobacterium ulcerans str. Harvey]
MEHQHSLRRVVGLPPSRRVPKPLSTSGAGSGFLSARWLTGVPDVTALDVDADVLRRAEHRFADTSIWWVHGDVMTGELPHRGFDAVLASASLHHIEGTRGH